MDDPNITMEEYIRLEEEKAQRHGLTFDWQTAMFGKVKNYEDEDDCFADFETEFPTIVFDNPITSNTALPYEPTVSSTNENKIDFRIFLDESDDEDYTVIFDENSFSNKIIYVNDLKMDSESDEILIPSSSEPTVDYLDDLDYFNDFKNEFPAIVYNDGLTSKPDLEIEPPMPSNLIMNLYVSFGIPFDPKQYYKDVSHTNIAEAKVEGYDEGIVHSYEQRLETILGGSVNRVHVLDFDDLTLDIRQDLAVRSRMVYTRGDGQQVFVSHAWRSLFRIRAPLVREFIMEFLSTCRMSDTEMGLDASSDRVIPDKGDLRDYWIEISSNRDFLGPDPSYVLIRDLVRRLCHRMIAYSISGRGRHLRRHAEGRKSEARLSGGHFIGRLAAHFGLVSDEELRGLQRQQVATASAHEVDKASLVVDEGAQDVLAPAQAPPPPLPAPQPWTIFTTEQSRVFTSLISCMTQLMDASGHTYQAFDSTLVGSSRMPYQRRVRPRTGDASTSASPHTDDQPDP
ncbi:hypothetical protein Tco_0247523 [Tanacetum coccineum]